jgi:hypothetical protein
MSDEYPLCPSCAEPIGPEERSVALMAGDKLDVTCLRCGARVQLAPGASPRLLGEEVGQ